MSRINYTQQTLGNLDDVLTTDAFLVQFASIPGDKGTPMDLALRCKGVTLPEMSNEKVSVDIHAFQMHFRGRKRHGSGDTTLTFVEFKNGIVSTALRTWHEYVVGTDSGNSSGYKNQYSTTMDVTLYDTMGKEALKWRCFNVFPTLVPDVSLDSSSTVAMEMQATFSMDYYKQIGKNAVKTK